MRERGPPPEEGEQRQLDKPRIAPSLPPRWRRLTPLESSQWGCTRRPLTPWLRQRADSMPEEDATEMAANRRSWSDAIGHNRLASTTLPSRLPFLLLLFPSPPLPPSLYQPRMAGRSSSPEIPVPMRGKDSPRGGGGPGPFEISVITRRAAPSPSDRDRRPGRCRWFPPRVNHIIQTSTFIRFIIGDTTYIT